MSLKTEIDTLNKQTSSSISNKHKTEIPLSKINTLTSF